ncbi:MAG: hypothetical protein AAF790_13990, partial [Planctomycetota bacterium]
MPLRLLHLVGSAESAFLAGVSRAYAADCIRANADASRGAEPELDVTEQLIAYVSPGGAWSFPPSLADPSLDDPAPEGGPPPPPSAMSEREALNHIKRLRVDAARMQSAAYARETPAKNALS